MAIIRTKRTNNFTVIDNDVYADNRLSFQAMGLLSYLLSKPDNWAVNVPVLCQVTQGTAKRSGQEAVYSMLSELVSAGFVVRKKYANGKVDYFIFDTPQTQPNQEKPNQEKPNQEKPNQEKPNQGLPEVLINTERQQELNNKQELNVFVNAAGTETVADTQSHAEAVGSVDAGASTRTRGADDGHKSAKQTGRADNQRRFEAIAEIYNGVFADCQGVRQVSFASSKTNAKRQKQIPAAWAIAKRRVLEWADEDGLIDGESPNGRHCLEWFRLYFEDCKRDPFINGSAGRAKGHENWKPDFEYMLRAETMEARVFEGA